MSVDEHGGRLHRHGDPDGAVATADTPVETQDAVATPSVATDIIVPSQPIESGGSGFHLVYKGVNYVADINGSYANADSLGHLATDNVNAAAITVDYGIDAKDDTVYADTVSGGYTESDTNVAAAATEAVNDGLSVMVRPIFDFLPANYNLPQGTTNPKNGEYYASEFRAYFNPGVAGSTGANSFFTSYTNLMVQEATLAQQHGAQIFCIGTELDQLTGPSYESYWDTLITDVKQVFSGKLTYSALWDDSQSPWQYGPTNLPAGTGDITTQISFWNKLDYVGIDEYAPISDAANPSVSTLVKGWTQTPKDSLTESVTGQQSLISYYEGISTTLNMPLLFTELGYADSSDAAINPAVPGYGQDGNPDNATADPTLQANLYTAFFDAWQQDGNSSLAGTYLWNWEPDNTSQSSPFQVDDVPAETSVATGYAACYAAGTLIATPDGEVAVENLQIGDPVLTASGAARPVTWLGHRRIRFAARSDVPRPHPIRIRADAFAPGQPKRDLVLSPDHAVFVDGVLIPIRHLVNGATILRETVASVAYWHVELASHDILLAEGLPAESYLDTGNRAAFANADVTILKASFERDPGRVWAEHACAELAEDGPIPHAVSIRLAARAEALGRALPVTLDVMLSRIGSTRVVVPGDVEIVRLVSGTARPPEDGRRLGALVAGMRLDGVAVPLEDSLLADGFHGIETHGDTRVRWTDGAATLAIGRAPSHRILRIEVAMLKSDDPPANPNPRPAAMLA
jgi:hypothetical protein